MVAYVDDAGRTVLPRRYDGDQRTLPGTDGSLHRALPNADRLIVDGKTFAHCFDDITAAACGGIG